jgi:hypothetical protein
MMTDKSVTILRTISLKWSSIGALQYVGFLHSVTLNS